MFPNIEDQIYELFKQMENVKWMMSASRNKQDREVYIQNLYNCMEAVTSFINVQSRLHSEHQQNMQYRSMEYRQDPENQKDLTMDQLVEYDGSGGKPAYVAVNGVIYDVSKEAAWVGGSHFGLIAGRDLSQAFDGCHGSTAILNKLPVIGKIVEA